LSHDEGLSGPVDVDENEHDESDGDLPPEIQAAQSFVDGYIESANPIRPVWKPDISHLPDAIIFVDGVKTFVPGVGDRIVIDYSGLKYGYSIDTRCWKVDKVREDGYVGLFDPHQNQYGCTDWRRAGEKGLIIKIPDKNESYIIGSNPGMSKRRARAKEARELAAPVVKKNLGPDGKPKLGRPKGTINRKTRERLLALGHNPDTMARQQIDEVMARVRKDEYEKAKEERQKAKKGKKQ
jgi:hypothetical protein